MPIHVPSSATDLLCSRQVNKNRSTVVKEREIKVSVMRIKNLKSSWGGAVPNPQTFYIFSLIIIVSPIIIEHYPTCSASSSSTRPQIIFLHLNFPFGIDE